MQSGLASEGFHPSSKGARVHFSGKNRTVIDGPFAETKKLVAGFQPWQVKSLEEAIEWVKRCPQLPTRRSRIEPFSDLEAGCSSEQVVERTNEPDLSYFTY